MDTKDIDDWKTISDILYIHYDSYDHAIKADTFIESIESIKLIIEYINRDILNYSLKYSLLIIPSEPGSFLAKIGLYITGAITGLFAIANTDIGAAFIEGLTSVSPAELAKQIGQDIRTDLINAVKYSSESEDAIQKKERECKLASTIILKMTGGILEKKTEELLKIGLNISPDIFKARSKFYIACLQDNAINGLGFSRENEFPIPRSSFAERASLPIIPFEDEPIEWFASIEKVYVTSPHWDKIDQKIRNWKGKNELGKDCYFTIEDEIFWKFAENKELNLEVLDTLKVQWIYQIRDGRQKNIRVLRVIEFNNKKISSEMSTAEIEQLVGVKTYFSANGNNEPDLFTFNSI